MRLKRLHPRGNAPHRGQGEHGRVHTVRGLLAGDHMPQRHNSGYDDRKGYKEGPKISAKDQAKRPRGYPGIDQVPRLDAEVRSHSASERRDGYHTGKPSRGDTNVRRGEVGNGKGSAAPGVSKGRGVRGSPDTHLGSAGRGGSGRLGMHDGHKGPQPKNLSEDISHESFEKLGAD